MDLSKINCYYVGNDAIGRQCFYIEFFEKDMDLYWYLDKQLEKVNSVIIGNNAFTVVTYIENILNIRVGNMDAKRKQKLQDILDQNGFDIEL